MKPLKPGPNVQRLIGMRAQALIREELGDPFDPNVSFWGAVRNMVNMAAETRPYVLAGYFWACQVVNEIRDNEAADNPWRQSSDEQIAGEIIRLANEKSLDKVG